MAGNGPAGRQSEASIGEDFRLISNRQGGRRRGRGGGSGRAPNLSTGGGNRQDNRQRGNAAQLLEKYKGLARDMQMQGDRVQTETYLQFADHYFRVLNESRARFDEQRPQRGESGFDSGYDDEDQDESDGGREDRDEPESREPETRREPRREASRDGNREGNGELRQRRPRARRDEGDFGNSDEGDRDERIAADILPPAISAGAAAEEGDEEVRAPRRRARRPRPSGEEIAPAA
ncbi:MAG: DUF4167 domain-containing protein [Allosphingosinicella sp.]